MLFLRALAAFVALPGMVAGLIPWLIVSSDSRATADWFGPGIALLAAGLAVLLWCVRDFYVAGKERWRRGIRRRGSSASDSIGSSEIPCMSGLC